MTRPALVLTLFSLIAVELGAQTPAGFNSPRSATIPANGVTTTRIKATAGILRVNGVAGLSEIRIRGTARASRQDLLESINLVTRRDGSTAVIEADLDDRDGNWYTYLRGEEQWRALDLIIEVPQGMRIDATDGSGDLVISGVGSTELTDGSGSATVEDVRGDVEITDGSGDLTLRNVTGTADITDGSGSIRIDHIGGELTINDGSGEVVVEDAADVRVDNDGSGSITIRTAANVRIDDDGSGDINVHDITGSVSIGDAGSGAVMVSGVAGDLTVSSASRGAVTHSGVRGRVRVPSR